MTIEQHITIARIQAAHDAERFSAAQAARAQSLATLKANALERAGELALEGRFQESERVLELNFFVEED